MAKKKSASKTVKSKNGATETTREAATDTVDSTDQPLPKRLNHADIGAVAGQVWQQLASDGEQSIASLKKSIGESPDVVLAAIGWLAREDKLHFVLRGRTAKVSLH